MRACIDPIHALTGLLRISLRKKTKELCAEGRELGCSPRRRAVEVKEHTAPAHIIRVAWAGLHLLYYLRFN